MSKVATVSENGTGTSARRVKTLTYDQRRRVREMLADGEASTRAEAIAWVTTFEVRS